MFVTDASAELTGPELEFLASAVDAGPMILVALTKIDMYPPGGGSSRSTSAGCATIELGDSAVPGERRAAGRGRQLDDPVLERESGFAPFGETILGESPSARGRARRRAGLR